MKRRGLLTGIGLTLIGLLAGSNALRAESVVNVYNARHYTTDRQLWDSFEQKTGIKVNVVEGQHEPLIQRLETEAARSPADVFITVDAGRLAFAADRGLLQPVRSATLEAAIPAHLRHPDGLWYGFATRARVLVYAKDRAKPEELSTYEALANERFKNRVLIRSSTNIYNLGLVGALIEANGDAATLEWCKGLVANLARPPQGGDTDQIKAVAAGVGDVAISNSYYLATLAASPKPEDRAVADKVAIFFPNQNGRGTHVNISGAAVVKTAPNREQAVRFLEYLASPEAQRYFADVSLEYPANPAVPPHTILAGWGSFKQDTLNASTYARNSAKALKLVDQCGWK